MSQLATWRTQAANSLKILVPKIPGNAIGEKDEKVDDLIRTLSKLPPRPDGRKPYEGLFVFADLASWRRQAAERLSTLVSAIPEDDRNPNDGRVDNLIRSLSKLPARPADRQPYAGLFAPGDMVSWRNQAGDRLAALVSGLQGNLNPLDAQVDDLLRVLSNLPLRPVSRKPYEGVIQAPDAATARKQAGAILNSLVRNLKSGVNPNDNLIDDLIRRLNNLPPRPSGKEPYAGLFSTATSLISQKQLEAIAPASDKGRLAKLLPYLNQTMVRYRITTPLRVAHFLAQVGHESDAFKTNEEYASGDDYEGRDDLGNTQSGDGRRFKGRGLIQITGRSNYAACGKAFGIDLLANPQRLADFDMACFSAGWFWDRAELNGDADRDDLLTITRIINGGYNGLSDRQGYLARAKKVLNI